MISCTLTVVHFSVLQHKLLLFLPHSTFTISFPVGVVKIDNMTWLLAHLTAFPLIT